jgi:hypothetical protein
MPVKAAKKSRQAKPEPTLIIPDISKKETTFKGRLGSFFHLAVRSFLNNSAMLLRLCMFEHRVEEQETGQRRGI